jgi:uncharacterized membrane protein
MLRLLYSGVKATRYPLYMVLAGLDVVTNRKILAASRNETTVLQLVLTHFTCLAVLIRNWVKSIITLEILLLILSVKCNYRFINYKTRFNTESIKNISIFNWNYSFRNLSYPVSSLKLSLS